LGEVVWGSVVSRGQFEGYGRGWQDRAEANSQLAAQRFQVRVWVQGFEVWVWGLGWGLGVRGMGFGCWVWVLDLGVRVQDLGFRFQG